MKISNKILLVGLASILISILIVMIYGKNQIYNNPLIRIQHNAPDINKTINLADYHSIKALGDYEIQITNGANNLTMEDSQIISLTKIEVIDSVLVIEPKENITNHSHNSVKIIIQCPTLRSIEYLGSGM